MYNNLNEGSVYTRKGGGKCLINSFRKEIKKSKEEQVWVEFILEYRDNNGQNSKSEKLEEFMSNISF